MHSSDFAVAINCLAEIDAQREFTSRDVSTYVYVSRVKKFESFQPLASLIVCAKANYSFASTQQFWEHNEDSVINAANFWSHFELDSFFEANAFSIYVCVYTHGRGALEDLESER